ncbi:hypothetical protein KFE98_16730 [bacterium SCSIO 12741]|nr:hypothetical protein KFE98_16730 [bacterium SCSIO 12741]
MYVQRTFSLLNILLWSGMHVVWLALWGYLSYLAYTKFHFEWMELPWLPISLVGIAVSFYVGFKNNSSYDRLWEARKIWGAIVNGSRSWGSMTRHFVTNEFAQNKATSEELKAWHKKLIYQHLAWLMVLRNQLLRPTSWEHISGNSGLRRLTTRRMNNQGKGLFDKVEFEQELKGYLSEDEIQDMKSFKNGATRLIDRQSEDLMKLREKGLIDDFRHMELQKMLTDFYTQQGKCERIKNYPLPRQYASMSVYLIGIFIIMLPFGIMTQMQDMNPGLLWLTIPMTTVIGWVFVIMEVVGDWSENPFEGLGNDVPMKSLVRTIEIDLREMIEDDDIPEKLQPIRNVLM